MAITNKTLTPAPYFIPLSYHVITTYSVFTEGGVVMVELASFYNEATAQIEGAQPLARNAIAIKGTPTGDVETWIYTELARANDGSVEIVTNPYDYVMPTGTGDRFLFAPEVAA